VSLETLYPEAPAIAWSWLKSISRDLYALDETPLMGTPPLFPWDKLSQECAKAFALEGLSITPGELKWREKDDVMAGIAAPCLSTQISATGLEGVVSFWISRQDVALLMSKVLKLSEIVTDVQEEDLVSAFHRFLSIESLFVISQLDFDKRLSFKITSHHEERPTTALCQDIKIQLGKQNMLCRLVINNDFRKSWKTFFQKQPQETIEKTKLEQVQTTIHLEAGRVNMMLSEVMQLKAGDIVLLDHVFYIPDSEKSRLLLTMNGKPLFRARLKAGSMKILEIPLHNEVYDSMVEKVNPPPPNFGPVGQNVPPDSEENPFEDEDEEDEDFELVEATGAGMPPLPTDKPKAALQATTAAAPAQPLAPLTANDIPIQLVVEVGAVNISVQKLLELAPGNMIDLDIAPENGVNLVINGRIIGKGELLKIGETVGVRILQIGV